jgi:threonyl-tRNA synthetase
MGDDSLWERAEAALTEALSALGRAYAVNPGDGAFYGPKIDVHVEDSLGRRWQCGTVQLDFQLPERFSLEYVGPDGMRHRPIMIHRAILGSLERFSGVLVEHFAGSFPVWLAPAQIAILPVAERHEETARALESRLLWQNLRPEVKTADEKLGRRIRAAELEKIPYMAVIGDRELESGSVSLRRRGEGDLGSVSFEALGERLQAESSVDGVGRL